MQTQPHCLIRLGGTADEIASQAPAGVAFGDHVINMRRIHGAANVTVPEAFADELSEAPAAPQVPVLIGSSIHPAIVQIGGEDVQLGDVVRAAAAESGLSDEEWNALADGEREALIDVYIASASQGEQETDSIRTERARLAGLEHA